MSLSLTFLLDLISSGCFFSTEDSSNHLYVELVIVSDSSDRLDLLFSTITGTFKMSLNETDELVDVGVDISDIDSVITFCCKHWYEGVAWCAAGVQPPKHLPSP